MGWARFDDQYSDHPKILEAGPWAELLDMRAIIWSARHETDGLITRAALKRIGHGIPRISERVNALLTVGRWTVGDGGGYWVHAFLDYNPSRAEKEDQRRRGRERVRKHRDLRNADGNALLTRSSHRGGEEIKKRPSKFVERCARCDRLIGDGWRDCECPDLSVVGGDE